MERVQKAGHNHVERVAALEEYLTLARAQGETWFDAGAWSCWTPFTRQSRR
jgi:hypothetical protein